jgi:N-acetylmuramoyl-L-alanine amidase
MGESMNRHPRRQGLLRNSRIWILILLFFIISGTMVTFAVNNQPSPIKDQPTAPSQNASGSPGIKPKNVYKIVIDPGHGGNDPGADGASGIHEKDFNLSLAKKVYDLLKEEPMFEPYLTRTDDSYVGLLERAKFANDLNADALVSIHANFFKDPQVGGTETYYYLDNGIELAQVVHDHLAKEMGFPDRGVRKDKLKVLSNSNMPAILTETGYFTNAHEEAVMISQDGQNRAAQGIVDGIKQYFRGSN